jgi:hypothetical protein
VVLSKHIAYASQIASAAVSVWIVSRGIRRRLECDYELSRREQTLRWTVVLLAFGLTFATGSNLATMRVVAGIVGLTFVAWPNLAYYSMRLAEALHLVGRSRAAAESPEAASEKE